MAGQEGHPVAFNFEAAKAAVTRRAAEFAAALSSSNGLAASNDGSKSMSGALAKAPISFVIPKNKMSGALVPVSGTGVKWENLENLDELVKPARKTKWGPDLLTDSAVKKGRALAYQTRAEQIAALLDKNKLEYVEDEGVRSPSPEPVYDEAGQRKNTKEQRVKEALEWERRKAIGEVVSLNPYFKPPSGWKSVLEEAKLFIPQHKYPGFNFIGLILGPRGNTHRRMEAESGAKIAIRGKGSQKEGRTFRKDGKYPDGADEELHVYITAETIEKVDKAVEMIKPLLEPTDEIANMHKRKQLHELAVINGLVRFDLSCSICGEKGHRDYHCPEAGSTFKAQVSCKICGDGGHPTSDCPQREGQASGGAGMDKEYLSFLEELGGGLGGGGGGSVPGLEEARAQVASHPQPMGPPPPRNRQGLGWGPPSTGGTPPPGPPPPTAPHLHQVQLQQKLNLIAQFGGGFGGPDEKLDLIAQFGQDQAPAAPPPFPPPPLSPPPPGTYMPPPYTGPSPGLATQSQSLGFTQRPPPPPQYPPPLPPLELRPPPPLPQEQPSMSQHYPPPPQQSHFPSQPPLPPQQGLQAPPHSPLTPLPQQLRPQPPPSQGGWGQSQAPSQPWQPQPPQPPPQQGFPPWGGQEGRSMGQPAPWQQPQGQSIQQEGGGGQFFGQQQEAGAQFFGQQQAGGPPLQMGMQQASQSGGSEFGVPRPPLQGGLGQMMHPPPQYTNQANHSNLEAEYDSLMADIGIM